MTPEQWMAMQALYLNGGNSPYLYNTGQAPLPYGPELDPSVQYAYATMAMPNTNKAGELLPFNLDYQKSLTNYQQDINQMIADPLNAYMASVMGGEGSGAGFAPGVFDQVAKESPITFTQTPMLQAMAAAGGYQGTLAKMMLPKEFGGSGMNPGTAVATLQKAIDHPEEATKLGVDAAMLEQIKGELPLVFDTMTQRPVEGQFNWQDVTKTAEGLFTPMVQEQATIFNPDRSLRSDVIQKDNGQFYNQEMVDSPQLEWLKKMGLPDPNARYDVKYAMETDPTIAGLFQHSAENQGQADMMRKTFDAYTKKVAKQREAAAKARKEDADRTAAYNAEMGRFGNSVQQAMGDYTRGLAAWRGPNTERHPITEADIGRANTEQYNMHGINDYMPGSQPIIQPMTPTEQAAAESLVRSRRSPELNLPSRPEDPDLSIFHGRTPDEVAQLFNRASELLPKAFRPKRAPLAAERPVQAAMLRAAYGKSRQTGQAAAAALVPYLALNAAGRTPAKDVVQQRLLPMYASGAMGQQGLPTAYPNRNAVLAAFGG